jgi:ferredoxin
MDAMNKAMANEDMGPRQNAGLSKEPDAITVEFIGAKKATVTAYAGQKISQVANSARVPIKYNCKAGDCGTCEVNIDGKIVKACQAVLPKKKSIKIQPLK